MSDRSPAPAPARIAQMVNEYVEKAISDAAKYDNSELLDHNGQFVLHRLAREVYGIGWDEGFDYAYFRTREVKHPEASTA